MNRYRYSFKEVVLEALQSFDRVVFNAFDLCCALRISGHELPTPAEFAEFCGIHVELRGQHLREQQAVFTVKKRPK